ncbi:MAG: LysM peptidoglycan-binding domain-containing protein [Desulfobacterales bacterium]|nr:LysM peptidoglycan-binding domain-containing protein [Desulfobacterales bacterium]
MQPKNKLASEKSAAIGQKVNQLAQEHYQAGLKFYNRGRYGPARKEFLTALRYNPELAAAKDKLTTTKKEIEQVSSYIVHRMQPDESISTLADRYYGDYRKFHLIAEYNELEDATKVTAGQEIKIPVIDGMPIIADPSTIQTDSDKAPKSTPHEIITVKRFITHTIQPGESLSKLAQMYYGDYTKFDVIAKFNSLQDGINVRVGQEIKIPEVEGLAFAAEGKPEKIEEAKIPEKLPATEEEIKKPEETLEKKPEVIEDQTVNYREFGVELFKNNEYVAAITEFEKVLNVHPNDKTALNYISLAYFEKGRQAFKKKAYPQAVKDFESSLKYNQECAECREYINKSRQISLAKPRNEAIALYNKKKYKEAIVKLEAFSKMSPADSVAREYLAKAHFEQGLVLFGKEKYLDARDEFKAVQKYNKECDKCDENIRKSENMYKEVHYSKGLAYFGDQKLAEAIGEWESVSKLDPNYKDVKKNLTKARLLFERLESIKRSKQKQNKQ